MPDVVTGAVTTASPAQTVLPATVDPDGEATTYRFDYGTSTGLGSQTPPLYVGSGTAA